MEAVKGQLIDVSIKLDQSKYNLDLTTNLSKQNAYHDHKNTQTNIKGRD